MSTTTTLARIVRRMLGEHVLTMLGMPSATRVTLGRSVPPPGNLAQALVARLLRSTGIPTGGDDRVQ